MADAPKYSVVIPAYNAEATLAETLDAVLAQKSRDWECVVVNDGSGDGTGSIAQSYARREPRVSVLNQPNQGSGGAYNTGVRAARGEYVVMCSSDDILLPEHLGEMCAFMEQQPGYDIYSSNGYYLEPDGSRELVYGRWDMSATLTLSDVIRACFYSVGAVYRRSLFEQIGGYRTDVFGEDYDFWLRAMAIGARHRYLAKPLSLHRVSPSQKSADVQRAYQSDVRLLEDLAASAALAPNEQRALVKSIRQRERYIARLERKPNAGDPRSFPARLVAHVLGTRVTHRIAEAFRRIVGVG